MRAIFVRHAESMENAGEPCGEFALIPITAKGKQQALALAENWSETPTLIVCSSFLRTQQTAHPTINRFGSVEVEVWPVHEFTNLNPARWNGSLQAERLPHVQAFWNRCDPEFRDGDTAENFMDLLDRARQTLARLQSLPLNACIYIFSHGYFMNAVRSLVSDPKLSDTERMRRFVPLFTASPIRNTQRLELSLAAEGWTFSDEPEAASLNTA